MVSFLVVETKSQTNDDHITPRHDLSGTASTASSGQGWLVWGSV